MASDTPFSPTRRPRSSPSATSSAAAAASPARLRSATLTPAQWSRALSASPQLGASLVNAGVSVEALQAYSRASRSSPPNHAALERFLDPKPRGATLRASLESAAAGGGGGGEWGAGQGWDASTVVDWRSLAGTRDVTLLCSETALRHAHTRAGQLALQRVQESEAAAMAYASGHSLDPSRRTDRRTGRRSDALLPQARRFEHDAYYRRIVDERRSQEGRAPHKRPPPAVLYNGEVRETQPTNDDQRLVLEEMRRARTARADALSSKTNRRWGPVDDPSHPNPAEYVNTQQKKQAIQGCPAAAGNTYNRLFHLDLPSPAPGQVLAPRSAAEQARAQHIRDCTSHGRDYDPISHARMNVLPPSAESQLADKLCGRNAVARYAQDQRNAAASLAAEA